MPYERLKRIASQQGLDIYERKLHPNTKGLYADDVIWINRDIPTQIEKRCILAEELGHYHTSSGDILDQKDLNNRKQEKRARSWAYEYLVPLSKIIEAYHDGIAGRHALAEYLEVTEEFLQSAIDRYREKYGLFAKHEQYTICFEPLSVIESLEE